MIKISEMDTSRKLYEIELIIAKSREFDYTKKLVVFNVNGISDVLPIWHECDVLVCTNTSYLTEIEIKRSYADFLNDFKKKHSHRSSYIKNFYYCVPFKIKDKVIDYLNSIDNKNDWRATAGVMVFYEDNDWLDIVRVSAMNEKCFKLSLEQKLYLAQLGSMRVITLKNKILRIEKEIEEQLNKKE